MKFDEIMSVVVAEMEKLYALPTDCTDINAPIEVYLDSIDRMMLQESLEKDFEIVFATGELTPKMTAIDVANLILDKEIKKAFEL